MLVYGGMGPCTDAGCPLWDLLALPLSSEPSWYRVLPYGSGPPGRQLAGMVYDRTRRGVIIHGGNNVVDQFADTWIADLGDSPSWRQLVAAPRERGSASIVYDPNRARYLIYGGEATFCSPFCSRWGFLEVFEYSGSTWKEVVTAVPGPPARKLHSAVYDRVRDRMVIFGGSDFVNPLNDTWELSFTSDPTWRELVPLQGAPPPRLDPTAVIDVANDRLVVFGGYGAGGERNDVWLLSLGDEPRWTELVPEGAGPSPRAGHSAIYDPLRGQMVVFGGTGGGIALGDAWALDLNPPHQWHRIDPSSVGPAIARPRAFYDRGRDRMVVMATARELHALDFGPAPTWTTLTPAGGGPLTYGYIAMAYDDDQRRMIVFGGGGAYGEFYNDIWALQFGPPDGVVRAEPGLGPEPVRPPRVDDPMSLAIHLTRPGPATASVYAVDGRRVRSLPARSLPAGQNVVRWDGRDDRGQRVRTGIYWVHARTAERQFMRKVLCLSH